MRLNADSADVPTGQDCFAFGAASRTSSSSVRAASGSRTPRSIIFSGRRPGRSFPRGGPVWLVSERAHIVEQGPSGLRITSAKLPHQVHAGHPPDKFGYDTLWRPSEPKPASPKLGCCDGRGRESAVPNGLMAHAAVIK